MNYEYICKELPLPGQFQYTGTHLTGCFNAMGKNGWELVAVVDGEYCGMPRIAVFKRRTFSEKDYRALVAISPNAARDVRDKLDGANT